MEANKLALINAHVFRQNFSERMIKKMVPLIKELHLNPEEKILETNTAENNQIYFIEKGKIELCLKYRNPCFMKEKKLNKLITL